MVAEDLGAFTAFFADTYFRIVAEAVRRHDPQHVYLGSRFQGSTPETVAACAKYCDVVSFNVYREDLGGEEGTRFHALRKPVLIGEFQFGSTDTGLFWPGLVDVAVETERDPAHAAYLRSALADPDIVGATGFSMSTNRSLAACSTARTDTSVLSRSPISPIPVWYPQLAKPISLC